ncbi:DMT family transporter [Undibacterium umbellatum]|uniref:EamA family transporter n=1 Tax=Undibacterium umbellatum TaxID=2762300 RepID=A0ABR6ZCQ1_9BURK|nr:DMT family transporter [Undibacterium umbellatum]MBC3909488.1 EamA family transporter [Undibacterium umbellatum]
MSTLVVLVVLFAAFLHAAWNAVIKVGNNKYFNTVLVTSGAGAVCVVLLPFVRQPDASSWVFMLASVALQVVYFYLLAAAYRHGDMSEAYPLMRGTAPLLVALVSGTVLGEAVPVLRWLGLAMLVLGILGLSLSGERKTGAGNQALLSRGFALLNACFIAGYTVVDGIGVRKSGAPAAYTMWIFLLTALVLLALVMLRNRQTFLAYIRGKYLFGIAGGAGSVASYGLALWAMTLAPVAAIAALRETSILFATAIAAWVLHETISARRLAAIMLAVAGAVVIRYT